MLRYLTVFIMAVIFSVFYHVLIRYRVWKIKKRINAEMEKERIFLRAIKVENEILIQKKQGAFSEFKEIGKYLDQCSRLVDSGSVDGIRVVRVKKEPFDAQFLFRELAELPDQLLDLVAEQCAINRCVLEIQDPVAARLHDIKSDLHIAYLRLYCWFVLLTRKDSDACRNAPDEKESKISVEVKNSGFIKPCTAA